MFHVILEFFWLKSCVLVFVLSLWRQTHTSFYPGPRGQRYDRALEAEDRGGGLPARRRLCEKGGAAVLTSLKLGELFFFSS